MARRRSYGNIRKRDANTWEVSMPTDGYTANGCPKREYETVHGTYADAEARLMQLNVSRGNVDVLRDIRVGDYFEMIWLERKRETVRDTTYAGYLRDVKAIKAAPFAGARMRDLPRMRYAVEKWLDLIEHHGSRLNAYKTLRMGSRCAVRWGICDGVVTDGIEVPKVPQRRKNVVTSSSMWDYIDACEGDPVYPGIVVALATGMRRGEIAALDWSDVAGERIHVTKAAHSVKGVGVVLDRPKTSKSERWVTLPRWARDILGEMARTGGIVRIGPMLVSEGERMSPDEMTRRYIKLVKAAGLEYVQLKNLRHSVGTMLVREAHVPVSDVQQLLGHETSATTERYYVQESMDTVDGVASVLDTLQRRRHG